MPSNYCTIINSPNVNNPPHYQDSNRFSLLHFRLHKIAIHHVMSMVINVHMRSRIDVFICILPCCSPLVKKTSPETCPNLTPYHDLGLLIADSSDGSLNFPHSTVRVFFGALYFTLMLQEGKSVESLVGPDCEQPVFLMNPLFLYFCLGLLSDQNQLHLSRKEQIYQDLKGYVLRFVDYVQINLNDVRTAFPALAYCFGHKTQNQIGSKFLNDVILACQNIRVLVHSPDFVTDQILQSMISSLPDLNSVLLVNDK